MVDIKVDVVGAEAMHGDLVVVGGWEGVLEVAQTRSRRTSAFFCSHVKCLPWLEVACYVQE